MVIAGTALKDFGELALYCRAPPAASSGRMVVQTIGGSHKNDNREPQGFTGLHRALGNPRKPWIFKYVLRFLGYCLDFWSNIKVFG